MSKEEKELFEVTIEVLQKAGYQIIFPQNLSNLCCGMPFSSKGFNDAGIQNQGNLKRHF